MQETEKNWWDLPLAEAHICEFTSSEDSVFVLKALRDGTVSFASNDDPYVPKGERAFPSWDFNGDNNNIVSLMKSFQEDFIKEVRAGIQGELGKDALFHCYHDQTTEKSIFNIVRYVFKHGYLRVRYDRRRDGIITFGIAYAVSDKTLCKILDGVIAKWLEDPPREAATVPDVFGFTHGMSGYQIIRVGKVDAKLHRDNYNPRVMTQFDRVVSELKGDDPAGRLVLMEGEPGTGKTHLIQALIGALIQDSTCIMVPPSLMEDLSGPDFLTCLIAHRNSHQDKPLTLILEDADDCLVDRDIDRGAKADNTANLSALLNLSDGILGKTLDLRVVATTNQRLKSIDKAILRPGRLLERIHTGPLSPEQALKVFMRETGRDGMPNGGGPLTLAEVYELTRKYRGTTSPVTQEQHPYRGK